MSATFEISKQLLNIRYANTFFYIYIYIQKIYFFSFVYSSTLYMLYILYITALFVALQICIFVMTANALFNFHVKYPGMLLDINISKLCICLVSFMALPWKHRIT
jgi:hypothetical protein